MHLLHYEWAVMRTLMFFDYSLKHQVALFFSLLYSNNAHTKKKNPIMEAFLVAR